MPGREATPGTVLCLAATILLALVSFNTPLLKTLNFLSATYGGTTSSATATFGTLGYCYNGVCIGPKLGYQFDPNEIFGITEFSIPSVITKYLTYLLVLHIVALVAAAVATVLGLLSHIHGLALLCFPTCTAYIASAMSLLAFIVDLVIWYIAKARISSVSGATATVGSCVWLTLAAWLLLGLSGCAYGCGSCCLSNTRRGQAENRRNREDYQNVPGNNDYSMTNGKRTGPPVREQEVSVPLTSHVVPEEDKYLEDEEGSSTLHKSGYVPAAYGQQGDGVPGVGVGYGPRPTGAEGYGAYAYNQQMPQQPYTDPYRTGSPATSAGSFAGVGAGRQGGPTSPTYGGGYAPGMGGPAAGVGGYAPGGSLAGAGIGMAGLGGAGAGMAAANAGGLGGYGGYGVEGAYGNQAQKDPYSNNNYPPQHSRQSSVDHYNQTYPPQSSQTPVPVVNSNQPRSPTGYNPYSNQPPIAQPTGYNTNRYSSTSSAANRDSYGSQAQDAYGGYEPASIVPLAVPQPQHIGGSVTRAPDFPLNSVTPSPSVVGGSGQLEHNQQPMPSMSYQDQLNPHGDDEPHGGARPPSYDSAAAGPSGGGYQYNNTNEKSGRL